MTPPTATTLGKVAIGVGLAILAIAVVILVQLPGQHNIPAIVAIAIIAFEVLGAGYIAVTSAEQPPTDRVLRILDFGRWIVIGTGALGVVLTLGFAPVLGEGIALALILAVVTFTAQRLVKLVRQGLAPKTAA